MSRVLYDIVVANDKLRADRNAEEVQPDQGAARVIRKKMFCEERRKEYCELARK